MVSSSNIRICYRDVVPFAAMVMIECIIVGGNTLFKSATSQGLDSYVFTTYVFLVGFIFLIPCAFILFLRRRSDIPQLKLSIVVKLFLLSLIGYLSQIFGYVGIKYSSPTLSSVMSNLAPAFTFILAFVFRLNFRSHAKIVGTVVSISGALVATLYDNDTSIGRCFISRFIKLILDYWWNFACNLGSTVERASLCSHVQAILNSGCNAIVMGLGDSLHLGSVVGGTIISLGFYAVLWGKAKEDGSVHYRETLSTETGSSPLLQAHALEEGAGSDPNN